MYMYNSYIAALYILAVVWPMGKLLVVEEPVLLRVRRVLYGRGEEAVERGGGHNFMVGEAMRVSYWKLMRLEGKLQEIWYRAVYRIGLNFLQLSFNTITFSTFFISHVVNMFSLACKCVIHNDCVSATCTCMDHAAIVDLVHNYSWYMVRTLYNEGKCS